MRLTNNVCLTAIALALAARAGAQTTISTATTANVFTSSAGDVTISSTGTITPTAGAAVTIDSDNSVTNAGAITMSGIDNGIGIATTGTRAANITNSGTITIDETYTATDTNADSILEPPVAQGTGRYGIRIGGPLTGTINTSGAIVIKGNNSAGLYAAAPITGNVISSSAITLTGDNGYGIRLGQVIGNVTSTGTISATGQGSLGLALDGPVSGQVVVHSTIVTTGYSTTALPTSLTTLLPSNLLQGGSAMRVSNSIGGGLLIAIAPTDTTDTTIDADADGIADATEASAALTTYGTAPAFVVGSAANAVTLGTFGSTGAGLVINGGVSGRGVYAGFDATGVQIGGLGQPVTISGGTIVAGAITATANGANAYAFRLGNGATTPSLTNAGTISAYDATTAGGSATGIAINAGASLPTITNNGGISATASVASARASAILDASGTLRQVVNMGSIAASDIDGGARAIDASLNTTGFTYTQAASATVTAPSIAGAIVTGNGNDVLTASAGAIRSAVSFGAGNDILALSGSAAFTGSTAFGSGTDSLSLAGTSTYSGSVDFGTGIKTFTIGDTASFAGSLTNSGNVALALNGGTARFTSTGTTTLGSLTLGGGTIGVTIDPLTGAHSLISVAGATSITGATTINASLTSLTPAGGSFVVLQSGTLAGGAKLSLTIDTLPYLLTGALSASDTTGTVAVTIARRSAAAIGIGAREAVAYDPVYAAIVASSTVSGLFIGLTDQASTLARYRQMLPDYAGGVFDVLSAGSRLLTPDAGARSWATLGSVALWAQQSYWGTRQKAGNTAGYNGSGFGLSAGADTPLGAIGRIGLSVVYIYGRVNDDTSDSVYANQFSGGLHWAADWGGLHAGAYGNAAYVALSNTRTLSSISTSTPVFLTSKGSWHGIAINGGADLSYLAQSGVFYLRPTAALTYNRLRENAHSNSGGGAGFDLIVAARTSDEVAVNGTLALGVRFGSDKGEDDTAFRIELEGGRRQIVGGSLGATTAHFAGGQSFTLVPDDRQSGYTGAINASAGTSMFRVVASALAETRGGYHDIAGRIGLRGYF